jgi:hypothetical protein
MASCKRDGSEKDAHVGTGCIQCSSTAPARRWAPPGVEPSTQALRRAGSVAQRLRPVSSNSAGCTGTTHAPSQGMRLFAIASSLIGLGIGLGSGLGCATAPPPEPKGGPRGLRASEHLDAAHQHDTAARERESWPDARGAAPGDMRQPVAMPWYRSRDTGVEHERIAQIHRAKAAEIEAQYAEACGDMPASVAKVSPLEVYGVGGWNTATGVIVYLTPDAGTPDDLLARMKCHRAAMMIAPSGMEDCPLDLAGIALDARGDTSGITVSIVVRDPKLVPELQRRAAHDLEAAAQLRASQAK